jgi:hypothetical protein
VAALILARGALGARHRAALPDREVEDDPLSCGSHWSDAYQNGMVCEAWCWAGLVGFGLVIFSLYFFCLILFLFLLFSVLDSFGFNSNLFCRNFKFMTSFKIELCFY